LAAAHKAAREGAGAVSSAWSPGSQLRWRRVFAGQERELGTLRRWLRSLLPECPARDDVISVASEIASNAVVHTASGRGGWFAVEVTWSGPVVRVAVADGGARTGPRMAADPTGEHGRGLVVVVALSARTGVCGGPGGRLVWAEIPWDAGAVASGSGRDPFEVVIGEGEAGLASRFASVPAWFGRSTLQWWALARGGLVSAPSAQELASLLGRLTGSTPPEPPEEKAVGSGDRGTARVCGAQPRAGLLVRPVRRLVPGRSGPFGLRPRSSGIAACGSLRLSGLAMYADACGTSRA
jgi:hypothetical protein